MYSDSVSYSDEALFELIQHRDDQNAFAELYNRYWECLLDSAFQRLKSVEAAEEVVQEVFVNLYIRRKTIRLESSLAAYLKTALKYKVFNLYRAEQIHHKYMSSVVSQVVTDYQSPYENLQNKELSERIETATMLMPDKCREVFYLSRYEYLTQQDIASRLGITLSTVKKHLTKALRILRSELYSYRHDVFFAMLFIQFCNL
ncbi:RNA polymerase sigma-70 factor, ECF subfamily [Parapedobacter luteus]|uniref:RNA polymerase sigma-70 factor, ECF subfamily n=1 Tax=Parapedobacter luteus TaxID=623280 RepID=A0A1T5DS12_9SPHI|nr:RNA polymerase sigma-70 factor [Parapedobacter luteus]SKB74485.1 RNA polymerase sigma-70 factor, ECF subfamily [Parapedobacter luteus]